MKLLPEYLYQNLGQLVADMPDLAGAGPITPEMYQWLGRAGALVEKSTDELVNVEHIALTSAISLLSVTRAHSAHEIAAILHRVLAVAEMNAPPTMQGAFIPAGGAFGALQAISKVLSQAKQSVLIIDAYMDAKVLTDFAPLAPEQVTIGLLTDSFYTKEATLQPAAKRWAQQYGALRPLEVRLTPPRQLHDRLIFIDGVAVWSLTQSLKDFAARSPASILRVENELAQLKMHTYMQFWSSAQALTL